MVAPGEHRIGWRFPLNDGGLEEGFNDSGIETYRGTIYQNLAREMIQNSLDAADPDSAKPVEVKFRLFELESGEFPGRDELLEVLELCSDRYRGRQKECRFFATAMKILSQETIPFLCISDYNTTGLTGAEVTDVDDKAHESNWYNLVKATGVSKKPAGAGGSFGIGKHAAYACSDLRCVFYGTLDRDGVTAFQGVAKLAAYKDKSGKLRRGTGFYGRIADCGPILNPTEVSAVFRRSAVGTDIFIAGFKKVEDWREQIARSVLENFFVAIEEGKLIVDVDGIEIHPKALPSLFQRLLEPENLTHGYYKALVSSDAQRFVEPDFESLGRVRLYLHEDRHYSQRAIAMVRKTGMKVFAKTKHVRVPVRFVGVLIADGDGINNLLRSMEPATHDRWDPRLIEGEDSERKYGQRVLDKLYDWMNEKIATLAPPDDLEELRIEGVGELLVDEHVDRASPSEEDVALRQAVKAGPVQILDGSSNAQITRFLKNNVDSAPNNLHPPSDKRKTGDRRRGPAEKKKSRRRPEPSPSAVPIREKRIFCSNPDVGSYIVRFTPEKDGKALMSVYIQGEEHDDPARVANAYYESTRRPVPVKANTIGPISLRSNQRVSICLVLDEPLRVALEVDVYAP